MSSAALEYTDEVDEAEAMDVTEKDRVTLGAPKAASREVMTVALDIAELP